MTTAPLTAVAAGPVRCRGRRKISRTTTSSRSSLRTVRNEVYSNVVYNFFIIVYFSTLTASATDGLPAVALTRARAQDQLHCSSDSATGNACAPPCLELEVVLWPMCQSTNERAHGSPRCAKPILYPPRDPAATSHPAHPLAPGPSAKALEIGRFVPITDTRRAHGKVLRFTSPSW